MLQLAPRGEIAVPIVELENLQLLDVKDHPGTARGEWLADRRAARDRRRRMLHWGSEDYRSTLAIWRKDGGAGSES